jgi:hypothetical protein
MVLHRSYHQSGDGMREGQSARAETFREFKYYATPNSETRVMKLASDFVLPALRKKLAVAGN